MFLVKRRRAFKGHKNPPKGGFLGRQKRAHTLRGGAIFFERYETVTTCRKQRQKSLKMASF